MRRSWKLFCLILACSFVWQTAAVPCGAWVLPDTTTATQASEPVEITEETQQPSQPTETQPPVAETLPVQTLPAQTLPEETAPTETVPAETVPVETVPEQTVDTVPLYFQTDYPDVYYGDGTMDRTGSSVTALAMVATYLTGHEYQPDQLARYFTDAGFNSMERLEYGSKVLQLPYEKNWDWHVTLQALREGKVAIVLVDNGSYFTQSQHFLVLTGLTEDGRVLVNDPNEDNYTHWALKHGYEQGFTQGEIVCGFQGAWVYDKSAMPEDPFVFEEELVDASNYGDVPLYFQNDYPDVRYANGTVATSGCSITSLAMVATYLTGYEYLPDELARYFGGDGNNNMERLEIGSDALQLPYTKNTNWHTTLQALREGKVAIALMNRKSDFSNSQHFIVLAGLTPDGKVVVNDSFEENYSKWELMEGYERGFATETIARGFEGAWVYDPAAMPEEPFIYYEEPLDHSYSRYTDVDLTRGEEELLAKVIWVEARGECREGQQAVAEVALNRLVSGKFEDELFDVIYGGHQFRSAPFLKDAKPTQAQYEAIEAALYGESVLPMDVYYFARTATNSNVWGKIGNHVFCYEAS